MDAYTSFAEVYDTFMDNIPYDAWSNYVMLLLKEYGIEGGLILELGCGTGNVTKRLDQAGYDMIGIDNSQEMLQIALGKNKQIKREEKEFLGKEILYLQQDMREFELYGTVKGIISICDSMNYILEEEELLEVFKLANNYLDPGGMFLFDMNTVYKYKELLGNSTIAENREESSFIWDNYFYEEESINEYELSIFVKEEENLYRKYEETHYQRGYEVDTVIKLIEDSGLEFLHVYDGFTKDKPSKISERVFFVAREKEKKKLKK